MHIQSQASVSAHRIRQRPKAHQMSTDDNDMSMRSDLNSIPGVAIARFRKRRDSQTIAKITTAAKTILSSIGDDPERKDLQQTPERFAKAMAFFTQGYGIRPELVTKDALFEVEGSDMVIVRDIHVASLCEHHLVPFVGKIHIGYIPKDYVLGLSKFARLVEIYARRLQVQERLTEEVADAVQFVLGPKGLIVVGECSHMCMVMRGVQQTASTTITQCKKGVFHDDPQKVQEFIALLGRRGA
ncbi:GTP cyclohydrolase 1 [Pseudocercospora fuligena]|uniref:GTP cyclohydrolase 1 n=1 Tax=Pseudocercospora fuligena TaxID=685502 RepID=A0A8H6VME4_9PEZI|nr:GTP cyclohydrolase 1 [Pseudocercospora fuligena]